MIGYLFLSQVQSVHAIGDVECGDVDADDYENSTPYGGSTSAPRDRCAVDRRPVLHFYFNYDINTKTGRSCCAASTTTAKTQGSTGKGRATQ